MKEKGELHADPRIAAIKKALADRLRQIYVMHRMDGMRVGLIPDRRAKVRA